MSAPYFEGTTPLVSDRYIVSFIAGGSISVGDLVEMSSDWTVVKTSAANSLKVVGVALTNASAGQRVSVVCRGLVRAKASGTINAGDQVASSATAGAVGADNTSKNSSIIGVAVTAASGGYVYILLW